MLFMAKMKGDQFYVNPEDAKKYADRGYKIIDINTGRFLDLEEISELKAVRVEGVAHDNVKRY